MFQFPKMHGQREYNGPVKWRYTSDGLAGRLYIEHLEYPRFRAAFVDEGDGTAEVQLLHGDALGKFEWTDPRPADEEVRRLALEADAYAITCDAPEEIAL